MSNYETKFNKNPARQYTTAEEKEIANKIAHSMYRYDQFPTHRIKEIENVTERDIKRFWEEGYIVIDQVINQKEVTSSLQAISDILAETTKGPRIQFPSKRENYKTSEEIELAARVITNFVDYESRLMEIAHHQGIINLVYRIFGEKGKMVSDMALLKPPFGGTEKPWHQDMAYGNFAFNKSPIGVWIALDPAQLDNGCMHVIPNSHRNGAVPHYAVRDWQICDSSVQIEQDVAVPLKPGGALIFSSLLHHGTPPNFSDKRRRSLQFHYAPESAVKLTPQEYKRIFTNELTRFEC